MTEPRTDFHPEFGYPDSFRWQVVQDFRISGDTRQRVAERWGISEKSLYRWSRAFGHPDEGQHEARSDEA